jgi:hypothetical protein
VLFETIIQTERTQIAGKPVASSSDHHHAACATNSATETPSTFVIGHMARPQKWSMIALAAVAEAFELHRDIEKEAALRQSGVNRFLTIWVRD